MRSSLKSDYHHYEGLDAWRGIALLAVMFSHYFISTAFGQFCWIGVEMFFVLSGFLITGILLQSKEQSKHFFKFFYIRRALRIVPFYALFLITFFLSIHLLKKEVELKFYLDNWWYYALFIQNWLFGFKGLPAENYLSHLWSLSVEEQFYIMWPLVIYFVPRKRLIRFIILFIGVACLTRVVLWEIFPTRIGIYYCNTFTRIDSICMGSLLSCTAIARPKFNFRIQLVLIVIIVAAVFLFKDPYFTNPFFATVGYTIISFFFFLLLGSFIRSPNMHIIKRSRALNYLGKISYCMYLTHIPIYFFIKAKMSHNPLLAIAVSFLATAIISSISFEYYESRFLALKKYFPTRTKQAKSEYLETAGT